MSELTFWMVEYLCDDNKYRIIADGPVAMTRKQVIKDWKDRFGWIIPSREARPVRVIVRRAKVKS